jgi:hypothetical protein
VGFYEHQESLAGKPVVDLNDGGEFPDLRTAIPAAVEYSTRRDNGAGNQQHAVKRRSVDRPRDRRLVGRDVRLAAG